MKYRVMLVKDTGETVDESAELLSAENAVALIKAWESVISRPTKDALDLPSATVNGKPSQTVSILNGVDLSGTARE